MILRKAFISFVLAFIAVFSLAPVAVADSNNCKAPEGFPDVAGAGIQGSIDSKPEGGEGKTMYEKYGWSGLSWHTCDLGEDGWISMPEAAKDPGAFLDTSIGSALMGGASTIAAFMTQLGDWVASPGSLLSPVDDAMVQASDAVKKSLWVPWSSVVVVGAACSAVWWTGRKDPRRTARTVIAIAFAALSVAALGKTWNVQGKGPTPGAVALGSFFDDAASSVMDQVMRATAGNVNSSVAQGSMFYDKILLPLWVEGAVGRDAGDPNQPGTLAYDAFRANTLSWDEVAQGKNPADKEKEFVRVAKVLDGKDKADYAASPARYDQYRGVNGGRSAIGGQALLTMIIIAIIRIPALILLLAGLLVVRLIVMFLPIWALFSIVEKTRPTAVTAAKMVFAAIYNAAVFGSFGVVYISIVAAIVNSGSDGFTFQKLVLIAALAFVVWKVSEPFRSVTVPATGDVLAGAGSRMTSGLSPLTSFGAMYLANRLANRPRREQAQTPADDPEDAVDQDAEQEGGYTVEEVPEVPRVSVVPIAAQKVDRELPPVSGGSRELPPVSGGSRELPPAPGGSPELSPAPDSPPQLPPVGQQEDLVRSLSPIDLKPVEVHLPVEVDVEVLEPTRILEEVQRDSASLSTLETDSSNNLVERGWREVSSWQPPTQEELAPRWEDSSRWRPAEPPKWEPPKWEAPKWEAPKWEAPKWEAAEMSDGLVR